MSQEQNEIRGAEALLFAEKLRKIRSDAESWTVEYSDDESGERWLLDYPDAADHGGGSPRLRKIQTNA